MKFKKLNIFNFSFLKKLIPAISIFILAITTFTSSITYADNSKYYSHLTQQEIEDIFKLKVSDIPDPWTWLSQSKTFVIVEDYLNDYTYWWNTPNIQMSAQNSLYDMISMSGYGSGSGEEANKREWLVDLGDSDNANTALKKYGFSIPSPTYVGERPLITISIGGVLMPDSVLDGFGRVWDFIWDGGDVIKAPSNEDMNSLIYVAPRDYETSGITFERWVDDNWYEAIGNIKSNQVLLSSADENGIAQGKQWIKEWIINKQGLNEPGLSAKRICQELEQICGEYYPDVAKNIILASGIGKAHQTERIMPYDISRMSSNDAKMFDGIKDPRSEMQQSLFSTGYDKLIWGMFKSSILSLSGKISEITVALNGFTNFTFLENIGLNPLDLWNDSILQILLLIMLSAFIFYVVKSSFKILKNGNYMNIVVKAFCTFLIMIFVFNISYNSENTYKFIKNVSTSIFNLANVTFHTANDDISALYGNGDAADRENVQLWLPYFNTWTSYQTNHTILDSEQKINKNDNYPELNNIITPNINGVEQTLWSTILADTFVTPANYSGNIYRVVDHFMAPRIENFEHNGENIDIQVSKNENYNGNIQSAINLSGLPFQILILFFVVFKVLLFFEFIFNIALLLFNLTLSVTSKYKIITVIKELGASMLNVAIINFIIGLVVWSSLSSSGFGALAIFAFYIFLTYNIIKELVRSNSVFTPKFFRPAQRAIYNVKDMFTQEVR